MLWRVQAFGSVWKGEHKIFHPVFCLINSSVSKPLAPRIPQFCFNHVKSDLVKSPRIPNYTSWFWGCRSIPHATHSDGSLTSRALDAVPCGWGMSGGDGATANAAAGASRGGEIMWGFPWPWGYPFIAGWFLWRKIPCNWMMTRGSPILGHPPVL